MMDVVPSPDQIHFPHRADFYVLLLSRLLSAAKLGILDLSSSLGTVWFGERLRIS